MNAEQYFNLSSRDKIGQINRYLHLIRTYLQSPYTGQDNPDQIQFAKGLERDLQLTRAEVRQFTNPEKTPAKKIILAQVANHLFQTVDLFLQDKKLLITAFSTLSHGGQSIYSWLDEHGFIYLIDQATSYALIYEIPVGWTYVRTDRHCDSHSGEWVDWEFLDQDGQVRAIDVTINGDLIILK